MVSATRISKIVGVSEEELINRSLISFIEREIRLAEADIADIRERYNVISKEELYEAIKAKKIASHPAWEDYIVWKNKERRTCIATFTLKTSHAISCNNG